MAFIETVWELFLSWLELFIAPVDDIEIIWILAPIWISWFFTEFFQEKKGTHFGNAITNGAIPIWVAIDWTRYLVTGIEDGSITSGSHLIIKFVISGFILFYGLFVIVEGLKTKSFVHYAGRIRVITYILVMFTPIIYGVVEISWSFLISIFVFFPLFYFFVELLDKITPDSGALKVDVEGKTKDKNQNMDDMPKIPDQKSSSQNDPFNTVSSSSSYPSSDNQSSQEFQTPDFNSIPNPSQMPPMNPDQPSPPAQKPGDQAPNNQDPWNFG